MLSRREWTAANYATAVKVTKGTGVFPEALLAIAIVESQGRISGNWYPGAGLVARKANNYFGIKKGVNWTGPTIALPTPGDAQKISTFRVYQNFEESARDFVRFLQTNSRYTKAGVFQAPNFQEQIIAIARAGYSESSSYSDILLQVATGVQKIVSKIADNLKEGGKWIIPIMAIAFFFVNSFTDKKHGN